ncbi:exported hypothetical protein [Pseudomonas jessenii]
MKLKTSLAALVVAASLFGCTTSSTHGVNVNLVATRQNAGQIGTVTLTDWDKKTGLSFFISGAPMGVTLPLRLYSFINNGTCQQPGSVAYAMNDTVNTERQPVRGWSFTRTAPVPLQTLLDGKYSVVVRTASTDGNVDIFLRGYQGNRTSEIAAAIAGRPRPGTARATRCAVRAVASGERSRRRQWQQPVTNLSLVTDNVLALSRTASVRTPIGSSPYRALPNRSR